MPNVATTKMAECCRLISTDGLQWREEREEGVFVGLFASDCCTRRLCRWIVVLICPLCCLPCFLVVLCLLSRSILLPVVLVVLVVLVVVLRAFFPSFGSGEFVRRVGWACALFPLHFSPFPFL